MPLGLKAHYVLFMIELDTSSALKKYLLRLRTMRRGVVTLVEPCSAAKEAASAVSLSRS